jgi:hypothetical protein
MRPAPRARSTGPRRPCLRAVSTAASAPGIRSTQHRYPSRTTLTSALAPPVVLCCSGEPPVTVLIFLARAAGTALVAADLAPA